MSVSITAAKLGQEKYYLAPVFLNNCTVTGVVSHFMAHM